MFEIEKINQLIMRITAIMNYAKDIHYTVHGDAFFGKHLFADRIDGDNNEYIDLLFLFLSAFKNPPTYIITHKI